MLLWDLLGKFPGSDYESFNYEWIIGKLKELKDSVTAAKASEEAASGYANDAKSYMQDAKSAKNQAAIFATRAGNSAEDAANSAESIEGVVNQVNANTSRIDGLIATAGDGTIPSELTDMRIAFDGTTFPTAGAATRWEASFLDEIKMSKNDPGIVKPFNIDGVTVTGGNAFDDAIEVKSDNNESGFVRYTAPGYWINANASYKTYLVPIRHNTTYTSNYSMRFFALLKNKKTLTQNGVTYYLNALSTTVGSYQTQFTNTDADYLLATYEVQQNNPIISPGTSPTTTEKLELPDWLKPSVPLPQAKDHAVVSRAASMNAGDVLMAPLDVSPKNGFLYSATVTGTLTNGTVYLGLSHDPDAPLGMSNVFKITSSTIEYRNGDSGDYISRPLTITLAEKLYITVKTDTHNISVELQSGGEIQKEIFNYNNKDKRKPMLYVTGQSFTGATITASSDKITTPTWIFGDSYISYANDRWPYYMYEDEYGENVLMNGYSGEPSAPAITSFSEYLKIGRPDAAVWLMGMNDGTDTEGAPSPAWLVGVNQFIQTCEDNSINPILATVPSVPTVNNEQKNAWVRNSGYRYIDMAAAVGANANGEWYTGMLSSDNVHPTSLGAKALYAAILAELPEITY